MLGNAKGRGLGLALAAISWNLSFSGIIGSGLCVFSKHPIQEFTQHVYTLNGYPYMVSLTSHLFHLPSPPHLH